jgi:transcriptional regulator with XRE-family HTH domain
MLDASLDSIEWETLGQAIRKRRLARELTLLQLAAEVDLSQPFLSQVENGRARPSMMSLYRIAHSLGTTPQAFFGAPLGSTVEPVLVRAGEETVVDVTGTADESKCHLKLAGNAPFHVLEFEGLPTEFLGYWEHEGFEALYVIDGRIEIDLDGDVSELGPGDFMSYQSRTPHRLRSVAKRKARVMLIETKVESLQDRSPARHAPEPVPRRRNQRRDASKGR